MYLCQNSSCVCLFTTLLLEMHKKNQKSRKVSLGNIDKIKIITKYGGVSIGFSWLTKTFIDVFYSKKAKNGLF